MGAAAVVTDEMRAAERQKYRDCYTNPSLKYAMGAVRMLDAQRDLDWMFELGCRSYLDVGCGRGEMLAYANEIGFHSAHGTEIVEKLQGDYVFPLFAHELAENFGRGSIDAVTSFDVIEHLHPGDDIALLDNMAHVARGAMAITANNRPSIDPTNGNDLHINKRHYDEWDAIIREAWSDWVVIRCNDKRYVSETWRAHK